MKKALILGLVVLIFTIAIVWTNTKSYQSLADTPRIGTSTFALYDIVKHIAPESVEVFMVMPFGVDIHSFEPTPKSMAQVQGSDYFFYSGAGLEPWTAPFATKANVIDMSHFVNLDALAEGESCNDHQHEHHHNGHEVDPHYWLALSNMKIMTQKISGYLQQRYQTETSDISKKTQKYLEQLSLLEKESDALLKGCQKEEIVVNHNAFGYLAHEYHIEVHALSGFSPEAMPSASKMATLVHLVTKEGISTIFFESFVSDKLMRAISDESGAKVDVLQPLANISADDANNGADYISLYRANIVKIAKALACQ